MFGGFIHWKAPYKKIQDGPYLFYQSADDTLLATRVHHDPALVLSLLFADRAASPTARFFFVLKFSPDCRCCNKGGGDWNLSRDELVDHNPQALVTDASISNPFAAPRNQHATDRSSLAEETNSPRGFFTCRHIGCHYRRWCPGHPRCESVCRLSLPSQAGWFYPSKRKRPQGCPTDLRSAGGLLRPATLKPI